jgi:mannose-1-phosphate guanylyltransferase
VAVGPGAAVGPDAQVDDSVMHAGARVGAGARVTGSVLAPLAVVGDGAIVRSSVVGEGGSVPAGMQLVDGRVAAGEEASAP